MNMIELIASVSVGVSLLLMVAAICVNPLLNAATKRWAITFNLISTFALVGVLEWIGLAPLLAVLGVLGLPYTIRAFNIARRLHNPEYRRKWAAAQSLRRIKA